MKNRLLIICGFMVFIFLFVAGCRKSDQELTGKSKGKCQLVNNEWQDGFFTRIHYNDEGLADEIRNNYPGFGEDHVTMEYKNKKRLTNATFFLKYYAGELAYTISFVYEGNRISKEIWYRDDPAVKSYEVVNTYNKKGQIVRKESFGEYVFYCTFEYDANGNAFQVNLHYPGFYLLNTYAFTKPVKNPWLAAEGIPYGFWSDNLVFNPWRQTAANAIIPDDQGNPITLYDEDPDKSILLAGNENYAVFQSFYDKLSDSFFDQTWSYQNCKGKNENCKNCEEKNAFTFPNTSRSSSGQSAATNKNGAGAKPKTHASLKEFNQLKIQYMR